jgi:mRNA interferase YafQ
LSAAEPSSATSDAKCEVGTGGTLDSDLAAIVIALAQDQPLATKHRDHALTGQWRDFRDCHIRPDLVLIYRKPEPETLQLVRLGSHSELGL